MAYMSNSTISTLRVLAVDQNLYDGQVIHCCRALDMERAANLTVFALKASTEGTLV